MEETRSPLAEIRALRIEFPLEDSGAPSSAKRAIGTLAAVRDVTLEIPRGQTVGVMGESGSGKTMTALSLLDLIPPPGRRVAGEIFFDGKKADLRALRGRTVSMIFQEPATAMTPVYTIGEQVAEMLRAHRGLSRRAAWEQAVASLDRVGIPAPRSRAADYPHQLSGGMRQRAMIAMALCCDPSLLIADEPTASLDMTVQAGILDLLRDLQEKTGMSILVISHDPGVIAELADAVLVMQGGEIVERGPTASVFRNPEHAYTRALLASSRAMALHG